MQTRASPSGPGSSTGTRTKPKRGEVWRLDLGANPEAVEQSAALQAAKLGTNVGHEQSGVRYAVVISDERAAGWGIVIVVPRTSKAEKYKTAPWAVPCDVDGRDMVFLANQVRALSTKRLLERQGELDIGTMADLRNRLAELLGI